MIGKDIYKALFPIQPSWNFQGGSLFHQYLLNNRSLDDYEDDDNGFPDTIRLDRINRLRAYLKEFIDEIVTPNSHPAVGEFISNHVLPYTGTIGYLIFSGTQDCWSAYSDPISNSSVIRSDQGPKTGGQGYINFKPRGAVADCVWGYLAGGPILPNASNSVSNPLFALHQVSMYPISDRIFTINNTLFISALRPQWAAIVNAENPEILFACGGPGKLLSFGPGSTTKSLIVYLPFVRIDMFRKELVETIPGYLGRFVIGGSIVYCDDIRECSQAGVFELIGCTFGNEGTTSNPSMTAFTAVQYVPKIVVTFYKDDIIDSETGSYQTGFINSVSYTLPFNNSGYEINGKFYYYGSSFGTFLHTFDKHALSPTASVTRGVSPLRIGADIGHLDPISVDINAEASLTNRVTGWDYVAPALLGGFQTNPIQYLNDPNSVQFVVPKTAPFFFQVLILFIASECRIQVHSLQLVAKEGKIGPETMLWTQRILDWEGNGLTGAITASHNTIVFADRNHVHGLNYMNINSSEHTNFFKNYDAPIYKGAPGSIVKFRSTSYDIAANPGPPFQVIVGQAGRIETAFPGSSSASTTSFYGYNGQYTQSGRGFKDQYGRYWSQRPGLLSQSQLPNDDPVRGSTQRFSASDIQWDALGFGDVFAPSASGTLFFNVSKTRSASGTDSSDFDFDTEEEAEDAAFANGCPVTSNSVSQSSSSSLGTCTLTLNKNQICRDRELQNVINLRFAWNGVRIVETNNANLSYLMGQSAQYSIPEIRIRVTRSVDGGPYTEVGILILPYNGSGGSFTQANIKDFIGSNLILPVTNPKGYTFEHSLFRQSYSFNSRGTIQFPWSFDGVTNTVSYRFALDATGLLDFEPESIGFSGGNGSLGFKICSPLNQGNYCITEDTDEDSDTFGKFKFTLARFSSVTTRHKANAGISATINFVGQRDVEWPNDGLVSIDTKQTRDTPSGPFSNYTDYFDISGETLQQYYQVTDFINHPVTMTSAYHTYFDTEDTKIPVAEYFDDFFTFQMQVVPLLRGNLGIPTAQLRNTTNPDVICHHSIGATRTFSASTALSFVNVGDTAEYFLLKKGQSWSFHHRGGNITKSKSWLGNPISTSGHLLNYDADQVGFDTITAKDSYDQWSQVHVQIISGRVPKTQSGFNNSTLFFEDDIPEGHVEIGNHVVLNAIPLLATNRYGQQAGISAAVDYNPNNVGSHFVKTTWFDTSIFQTNDLIQIDLEVIEVTLSNQLIVPGNTITWTPSDGQEIRAWVVLFPSFSGGPIVIQRELTSLLEPDGFNWKLTVPRSHGFDTDRTYGLVYQIPNEPLYGLANGNFKIAVQNLSNGGSSVISSVAGDPTNVSF